jgi:hypothetical protein
MEQSLARKRAGAASARPLAAAIVAAVFSITGCQGMATTTQDSPPSGSSRADNTVADWPLRFVQHSFGAFCYSTYACQIRYGGYSRVEPDDKLQIASESLGDKYPGNLDAGYLGIMNFPPPAQVSWRSKDGTSHQAEVDIGQIFKDQVVLHNVPREEVSGSPGTVEIILEINDRTINVYMRAFVSTNVEQIVGDRRGYSRRELILAWSRTY